MRIISDKIAASTEVPAKFSQIPVSPKDHRAPISITGKISAVDTDMMEAGRDFSIASI